MGIAKDRIMRRRFQSVGDKYVCANCFDDYAIREFINDNADEKKCSYCGIISSKPIAADMDEVIRFMLEGIEFEFGHPDNEGVPYESAEGGYQGEVFDTYDLLTYEIQLEIESEELFSDIVDSLSNRLWCQRDFFSLPPEKVLIFGWEEFANVVKHWARYVFFRLSDDRAPYRGYEEILPSQMLDHLARVVAESGVIDIITKGTRIYRARIGDPDESFETGSELGPPLPNSARFSNRMSPAGIPMFYGAYDELTALAETIQRPINKPKVATIATFRTLRDIRVVNLVKLPDVPSLFDRNRRRLRANLMFLRSFAYDVSQPIKKDQYEHIEYVPTQVFTEYLRHLYEDNEGNTVEGIVYSSVRRSSGSACVLFLENEDCCDEITGIPPDASKCLYLERRIRIPLLLGN